ncbi:MAG: hypothetical protein JSR54_14645 [Proteobacteria bacterium]|nr:hypothetical protein [Pseudomonadota bacterium]
MKTRLQSSRQGAEGRLAEPRPGPQWPPGRGPARVSHELLVAAQRRGRPGAPSAQVWAEPPPPTGPVRATGSSVDPAPPCRTRSVSLVD